MRVHVIQVSYGDDESLARPRRPGGRPGAGAGRRRPRGAARAVAATAASPTTPGTAGAQPLDGPVVTALRGRDARPRRHVHMGSFVERDEAGRLFNTSVLLGADGAVLDDVPQGAPVRLRRGRAEADDAGRRAGGARDRLGLATCYDLRFPELFRALLDAGAEVVLMPAAWPAKRVAPLAAAGPGARRREPVVRRRLQHRRHPRRRADGRRLAGRRPVGRGAGRGRRRRGGAGRRPRPGVRRRRPAPSFPVLADRRL